MEKLFLSFIVPVYNAERFLPECLNSLLHQDIPQTDYEILCVNDGSKDGSLEVLRRYQADHPCIRIIDKENGGVTTARNAGLENARGEYIWFVDSDDFLKENVLGKLRREIETKDCDRLIIGCYIFDDALTEDEKARSEACQLPLNGPGCDSIVVRSLFRRSFLKEHDLYFRHPELTHGEDGMFMYEACILQPSHVFWDEAIYFYRIHSGSADTADTTAGLQRKLRSYIRIVQLVQARYSTDQKNARTANIYMTFLWFALLTCASMPWKESRKALKEIKKYGLYPGRRLPECTLTQSYMTDRTDLIGRIYNKLYMNLHRPWGFTGMFLVRQLLRLRK